MPGWSPFQGGGGAWGEGGEWHRDWARPGSGAAMGGVAPRACESGSGGSARPVAPRACNVGAPESEREQAVPPGRARVDTSEPTRVCARPGVRMGPHRGMGVCAARRERGGLSGYRLDSTRMGTGARATRGQTCRLDASGARQGMAERSERSESVQPEARVRASGQPRGAGCDQGSVCVTQGHGCGCGQEPKVGLDSSWHGYVCHQVLQLWT